jgi:hypothetical protein
MTVQLEKVLYTAEAVVEGGHPLRGPIQPG